MVQRRELPKIPKGKRVLFSLPLGILVLLALLRLLIILPPVQSWLVIKASDFLERQLGTEVHLEKVDFALPARAKLLGLKMIDEQGDTLLALDRLESSVLNLSLWRMVFNRDEVQAVELEEIFLSGLDLNLYRRPDSIFNFQYIIDRFRSQDSVASSLRYKFGIGTILARDSRVRYLDLSKLTHDSLTPGYLNYANLDLQDINFRAGISLSETRNITLDMHELNLREAHSGMEVDRLDARFLIFPPDSTGADALIRSPEFDLRTDRTHLRGKIDFPGSELRTLLDARFDEDFRLELQTSFLDIRTINYLASRSLPIKGRWKMAGIAAGSLERLNLKNMSLGFGDSTFVQVSGWMYDIADTRRARMNLEIPSGYVAAGDLRQVLSGLELPAQMQQLRRLGIQGNLSGGYFDLGYKGSLTSNVGNLRTDLHVSLPPASEKFAYKGNLVSRNLNVNALFPGDENLSQNLNFSGFIEGTGLTLSDMEARIDAYIIDSDLLGYAVDSLYANVKIAEYILLGDIYGEDREGVADLNLDLRLDQSPAIYKAKGNLNRFNLKTYGLYDQEFLLTSELVVDMNGDSLEALDGELKLQSSQLTRMADGKSINVPDLLLNSHIQEGQRYLNLKSSMIDADLAGTFALKKIAPLAQRLLQESRLYLSNNDSLIDEYYVNKQVDTTETYMFFGVASRDSLNQIFDFLGEPWFIAPGSLLRGELSFGTVEQASIILENADSIIFPQGKMISPWLSVDLFKQSNQNALAATGEIRIDTLAIGPTFYLEKLAVNLQGLNNYFESDVSAMQGQESNRIQLKAITEFLSGGRIVTAIDSSYSFLVFQQDSLYFRQGGQFILEDSVYDIRNVMLEDLGSRYIRLDGIIAEDSTVPLRLSFGRLGLGLLEEFVSLPYRLGGLASADLEMYNLLSKKLITGVSRIDSFSLDDFPYGNIYISTNWVDTDGKLKLNASLWDGVDTTLILRGLYATRDTVQPVNFDILTQKGFPLNYAYPFVKTQLYGLEGRVELEAFNLEGTWDDLRVNGTGHFEDAHFGIDYFKTDYSFNGKIFFDKDRITFPRIKLYDKYGQNADFHGTIRHRGLKEFDFSLQLEEMKDFLIMDTKKGENDLFYGTIFTRNGIADIAGDLENLVVTAFGTSGKGSSLKIPISDYNQFERPDYVQFVGDEEKLAAKTQTGLQGFELNLTTQVTEDIEIEMIFDEQVGDIMKGRGSGILSMEINADGEFRMNGQYEISEGDYLFTAQSIVNKKFEVKPGGTLTWNDDPYAAIMDIEAFYPVQADAKDFLDLRESQLIPVNVLMGLKGELLAPDIGLGIEIPNVSVSNGSEIVNKIRSIQYDQQELNKQVFSLMVFRRFAPIGGFGENLAGAGITSSISELISNQFNYWLSQATTDRLSVNIGTSNFQDVSLLVSYKLFNDRVTLERDGTLIGTNSGSSPVGNLRMIIKLLPSPNSSQANAQNSELVVEVFNRETLDAAQSSELESTNQTGIGIFYKRDFDSLQELLTRKKKKSKAD
jgi:hypothetical protein